MTTIAQQNTHTTVTSTNNKVNRPLPQSIRSIIRGDILAGVPKSETQAKINKFHPTTAACSKFAKHYGWYKGQIKKEETNGASLPIVSE
jgi:hypothetical protein